MSILEVKKIRKTYQSRFGGNRVEALRDVTFSVEPGEYVAIMGPSGSGKTTLMNIIGCLDVATKGSYLLAGEDVSKASDTHMAEIRNHSIGFVFQQFNLLPKLTAQDNVALPLLYGGVGKKERRARAKAALEKVGLGDRVDFRPNQMSGGQCQRVAIARAIVGMPKLLLADEPTGALDYKTSKEILKLIETVNQKYGNTVIMVTHNDAIRLMADRVVRLRDGAIRSNETNAVKVPAQDLEW